MSCIKIAGNGAKKNIPWGCHGMRHIPGGWGGIRTPGGVAPTTVFKTAAFDRSATHPKLFYRRPFNLRFCSLVAPDGAAHHSFALDFASLVSLTRMQDRRYCPALPPILNSFTDGLSTYGFVRLGISQPNTNCVAL